MSLHAYLQSLDLAERDIPFDSLVMAAMRRADSENVEKLKASFPDIWADLFARYHAPGGRLPFDAPAPTSPEPSHPPASFHLSIEVSHGHHS